MGATLSGYVSCTPVSGSGGREAAPEPLIRVIRTQPFVFNFVTVAPNTRMLYWTYPVQAANTRFKDERRVFVSQCRDPLKPSPCVTPCLSRRGVRCSAANRPRSGRLAFPRGWTRFPLISPGTGPASNIFRRTYRRSRPMGRQ
jgi:hypothetical protein